MYSEYDTYHCTIKVRKKKEMQDASGTRMGISNKDIRAHDSVAQASMFSLYKPTKVIRDSNDPFFEEGNIAIRAYWLERDARSEQDIAIIRQEASMLAE